MMTKIERNFLKVLRENCPVSYRIDPVTKKPVKVPCGSHVRAGSNKRLAVIQPGDTPRQDETGQMHSVPPCQRLKAGANKKAIPVCSGEATTEKNGQITKRIKPKNESRSITLTQLFDRVESLQS